MEFRVTETLSPTPSEPVLSALEHHLRSIATIVDGHQGVVTAFGLGPARIRCSPADVAIFEVFPEASCTLVKAVVHYDEDILPVAKGGNPTTFQWSKALAPCSSECGPT